MLEDLKALERRRHASRLVTKYPRSGVLALKAIFDEYDRDGSGCLDRAELTMALQRRRREAQRVEHRGKTLAERQAEAGRVRGQPTGSEGVFLDEFADSLFDVLDSNSDARIEFEELLRTVYPLATALEIRTMLSWVSSPESDDGSLQDELDQAEQARVATLHAMFDAYDRNSDGKVSVTEFRMAMLDHANYEEIDSLFRKYDANGNGEVDFEEFCAIVSPDLVDE